MAKLSKVIHFYDDNSFKEFKPQEVADTLPFVPTQTYGINYAWNPASLPSKPKTAPFCSQCGVPMADAQMFDTCPNRDCPVERVSRR